MDSPPGPPPGVIARALETFASIRKLMRILADTLQLKNGELPRRAWHAAALASVGFALSWIGVALLCVSAVHLLQAMLTEVPLWASYATVGGLALLGGMLVVRWGKQVLPSMETPRASSAEVLSNAESAVEGISETIESAQRAGRETVASIKRGVDMEYQYEHHPWTLVVGAAMLGYTGASLLKRKRAALVSNGTAAAPAPDAGPSATHDPRHGSRLAQVFAPELHLLREMAVGAIMAIVQDQLTHALETRTAETNPNGKARRNGHASKKRPRQGTGRRAASS